MTTSMEEVVMETSRFAEIGARPVRLVGAGKGRSTVNGEPMIVIALGERLDDADYIAMTVADAARLTERLGVALRSAAPSIDRTTKGAPVRGRGGRGE
jgi:hypothetical protein